MLLVSRQRSALAQLDHLEALVRQLQSASKRKDERIAELEEIVATLEPCQVDGFMAT